jgi:subtilisin family serine protease
MKLTTSIVALSTAILLAACSADNVVAPRKTVTNPALAIEASQASPRYIVVGSLSSGFADRVTALGGTVKTQSAAAGFAVVSGLSPDAANALAASGVTLQPDILVSLEKTVKPIIEASDATEVTTNSAGNPATAARFNRQWNMRLINAPAAWAAGKLGSSNVTVAILDTGIDYDLPDLAGLVDLSRSHSFMDTFVGLPDDPTTKEFDATPIVPSDDFLLTHISLFAGRNLVTDLNGHGTNVATQVSSNAVRFAGVTSHTTLIGVKVLGANGVGSLGDILSGVIWAADHGADVANMSLGGGFSKSGSGQSVGVINQVLNYARKKGMLVVVSAGNSGQDLQHNGNIFSSYCDAPHVLCVSAVGPGESRLLANGSTEPINPDEPAFYTTFGKNVVDVAGPGGNIHFDSKGNPIVSPWPWGLDVASWVWSYCAKQSLIIQRNAKDPTLGDLFLTTCFQNNPANLMNNGYVGTSQAAPHVTGLAALLIAENGKGMPQKIKQLIQRSAVIPEDWDKAFGSGRIDVAAALSH